MVCKENCWGGLRAVSVDRFFACIRARKCILIRAKSCHGRLLEVERALLEGCHLRLRDPRTLGELGLGGVFSQDLFEQAPVTREFGLRDAIGRRVAEFGLQASR